MLIQHILLTVIYFTGLFFLKKETWDQTLENIIKTKPHDRNHNESFQ